MVEVSYTSLRAVYPVLDSTVQYSTVQYSTVQCVQVSYTSLRAVYPVLDSYSFPLVRSRVRCVCDCPGGAAHCPADLCGNTTNCHTHYSPSVPSTGCFLSWLQLSASLCCSIQVSATCHVSRVTRVTTDRAVQHAG